MCQESNRNGLCVRVRVHNPGLGQVHLVARCKHMFSNHRGQHIPLPQCSMMLPKALLQGPSSLPDVTPRALVTRDGVDHSLSLQLWNRVLGVDQLLPECPKWTESDPDVQVAEHSADGLGQPTDVWDSYGCSCCLGWTNADAGFYRKPKRLNRFSCWLASGRLQPICNIG